MSPVTFLAEAVSLAARRSASTRRRSAAGRTSPTTSACSKITPEQRETLDLSSWALAFNGAEPVREETIESFTRTFEPCGFRREAFYPCYGLAEATLIVSGGYRSAPPVIRHFDSKALENNQVVDALADEEGCTCAGRLRRQPARRRDRDRQPRHDDALRRRRGGRNLGLRPQRRPRLLEPPRRHRRHVPRVSRPTAAAVPSCAPATSASCRMASCSSPAGSRT